MTCPARRQAWACVEILASSGGLCALWPENNATSGRKEGRLLADLEVLDQSALVLALLHGWVIHGVRV